MNVYFHEKLKTGSSVSDMAIFVFSVGVRCLITDIQHVEDEANIFIWVGPNQKFPCRVYMCTGHWH